MPRGRPKGSTNKKKEDKSKGKIRIVKGVSSGPLGITETEYEDGTKGIVQRDENGKVIPFPSDWDKMGKVDRLKWLTANKR